MAGRFRGKISVVIGGNSGIGLATAKAFADEGASVVITGRDPQRLQAAMSLIGNAATAYRCDISRLPEIEALFETVRECQGHVDVLFVNAGVLAFNPIEFVTEDDWDWIQSTNLKGAFFTVQKALPLMSKGASIILTGSTAGRLACPTASVYAASKAGVRSLGLTLASELLKRGIRVNVVSPGPTDTPIFERARGLSAEGVLSQRKAEINDVPMMRMGTPEEVAAAVLFLASDAAAFITGVDLLVDGGCANL